MSLESLSPRLVGAGQPAAVDGVSLVSLGGLAPGGDPLTEVMEHRVGPAGARVLELRQSSRGPLPGARRSFRGRDYVVGRDRSGRALVAFDDGLVTHVLVPVGPPARGDLAGLLDLGDRLRSGLKRRR